MKRALALIGLVAAALACSSVGELLTPTARPTDEITAWSTDGAGDKPTGEVTKTATRPGPGSPTATGTPAVTLTPTAKFTLWLVPTPTPVTTPTPITALPTSWATPLGGEPTCIQVTGTYVFTIYSSTGQYVRAWPWVSSDNPPIAGIRPGVAYVFDELCYIRNVYDGVVDVWVHLVQFDGWVAKVYHGDVLGCIRTAKESDCPDG